MSGLTVRKIGTLIPVSREVWEDGMWFRWLVDGTSGYRYLDTRFAAEHAELSEPWRNWENEGGAL